MKSVRILSHTADMRLLIKGDSRRELFQAGLLSMARLLSAAKNEKPYTITKQLDLKSTDLTGLLIDFLNEVLTESHIRKCIFDKVTSISITDNHQLNVKLEGFEAEKFDMDIKAVTYHEARIEKTSANIYQTIIVLDI